MIDEEPISACPLSWPAGWKRTAHTDLQVARFGKKVKDSSRSYAYAERLTLTEGLQRVLSELERMGIDKQDVIVSTNVRTRLDGLPRSGEKEPSDSGAAVYWQDRKRNRRVLAIDQYTKVADNLAAIAATLDALRAVERHGGAVILERAFTGFTAIASPAAERTWREVFGYEHGAYVSQDDVKAKFRQMATRCHPDKPSGSHQAMSELNRAYEQATTELTR